MIKALATHLATIAVKLSIPLFVHVPQETLPTFARCAPSKHRGTCRSGNGHLAICRRVEEMLWLSVRGAAGEACTAGMVWRGFGRAIVSGVGVAAAVVTPWLGYDVPEAQQ